MGIGDLSDVWSLHRAKRRVPPAVFLRSMAWQPETILLFSTAVEQRQWYALPCCSPVCCPIVWRLDARRSPRDYKERLGINVKAQTWIALPSRNGIPDGGCFFSPAKVDAVLSSQDPEYLQLSCYSIAMASTRGVYTKLLTRHQSPPLPHQLNISYAPVARLGIFSGTTNNGIIDPETTYVLQKLANSNSK